MPIKIRLLEFDKVFVVYKYHSMYQWYVFNKYYDPAV